MRVLRACESSDCEFSAKVREFVAVGGMGGRIPAASGILLGKFYYSLPGLSVLWWLKCVPKRCISESIRV